MIPEEFNNHTVFTQLEQIQNKLQKEEVRTKIPPERLNFYDSVIEYISDCLRITSPTLVQETEMNALASELEQALSQINEFIGNNNTGHLDDANSNLNSAMNRMRNFPLPISKSKFNFSKEIANFQETVSKKYTELEQKNKDFEERLKELNTAIESKQQDLNNLKQSLDEKQNEITELTTNYTNDYDNIKSTANKEFEKKKTEFREEFDGEITSYKEQFAELKEAASTQAEDIVKNMESKLKESEKLVNITANVAVTGNYQKTANDHKRQADKWRRITLVFMVVSIVYVILVVFNIFGTGFDWETTLVRVIAFSALLYPVNYASKESAKHRRLENINRKLELDLASINPFIEKLPEEKKEEIIEKMVEKFFGNNDELDTEDKPASKEKFSVGTFEKILKAVIPFTKNN